MADFLKRLAARLAEPSPLTADELIAKAQAARLKREKLERQADEAFARYKELKEAEFQACREIADAETALMKKAQLAD